MMSEDIESDYSLAVSKIAPFNTSPTATCEAMKLALKSYGIKFLQVGQSGTIKLPGVEKKVTNKIESQQRFVQWYMDVIESPDSVTGRGKSFEGLIGGIFGGTVVNAEGTDNKSDVDVRIKDPATQAVIGNNSISIKFAQKFDPSGSQSLGGIIKGVKDQFNQDQTGVKEILIQNDIVKIGSPNIAKVFNLLLTDESLKENNIGYNFMLESLNRDKTFGPIDYFMFSNYSALNEILVYQYTKMDILKHIASNIKNFSFKANGIIDVKNLGGVNPIMIKIQFPQYVKSNRYKYDSEKTAIPTNFIEEPTLSLRIWKTVNGEETHVANIFRKYLNGELNYDFEQIVLRDNNGRKITIDPILKLEKINEAVKRDLRTLSERPNRSSNDELLIKKLKNYSDIKRKELFVLKSKTSDVGREGGIKGLIGKMRKNINPVIIQNIRKDPQTFIEKVFKVYGCDTGGITKLESALSRIFNVNIQLPVAQYCAANDLPQPEAVQESVNKVLKTLNEAIEKKK
jgi:hypothetical protein